MTTLPQKTKSDGEHWISISDMMTGLMMLFLFIAISYMIEVSQDNNAMREVAIIYEKSKIDLVNDLYNEFKNDLNKWGAVIDSSTISIDFYSPDVLFAQGSDKLRLEFEEILQDFFPRYMNIITNSLYKDKIEEIRIEGHTSSEWSYTVPKDVAYIKNMELSQNRTRSVLQFAIELKKVRNHKDWMKKHITANGLSSSKRYIKDDGTEDKQKSRRVSFRVKTNAEVGIAKILDISREK